MIMCVYRRSDTWRRDKASHQLIAITDDGHFLLYNAPELICVDAVGKTVSRFSVQCRSVYYLSGSLVVTLTGVYGGETSVSD